MHLGRTIGALGLLFAIAACSSDDEQADEGALGVEQELSEDVAGAPVDAFAEPAAVDSTCTATVAPARELMIRQLGVVEDPIRTSKGGAWTFGTLMTAMAGPNDPQTFVRNWLSRWETDRTVNSFTVTARPSIKSQVIDPWPKDASGKLDLGRAPLRLLAIVNRMDLRDLSKGDAGEGRFVFGVTDSSGNPLSFTVILEYKLPASTTSDVQAWANAWHGLGVLTPGTAAYNDALQAITDKFAGRGAAPNKPNGSSIGQVRTNEIALSSPWQLREFRLNANGQLVQSTVRQTPDDQFETTAKTARFINANEAAILAGRHIVPLSFESAPYRGGDAPTNFGTIWNPPGVTNTDARHLFSVNTCNGCHGGETQTGFLHVAPRAKGQIASLSGFLTGETITDPVDGKQRKFADLARRKADLQNVLCSPTAAAAPASARVH